MDAIRLFQLLPGLPSSHLSAGPSADASCVLLCARRSARRCKNDFTKRERKGTESHVQGEGKHKLLRETDIKESIVQCEKDYFFF